MKMDDIMAFGVRFVVKFQRKRKDTAMARHGENIRKRKDGRWEGRYSLYSEERERSIYRSVYGSSYDEVKRKLLEQRSRAESEEKMPPDADEEKKRAMEAESLTLFKLAEQWLDEVKREKKLSTYIKYRMVFENYVKELLGDVRLGELSDRFVAERLPAFLTDSMAKSIYCVLNQILKFTSRRYPATIPYLKRPGTAAKSKPVEVLSRREQTMLFSVLYQREDVFKTAVCLCLYTGLRLGEICALKWSDIDFDNQLLAVNRTVQRLYAEGYATKTALVETEPKSVYSRREIPLPDTMLKQLVPLFGNGEYIFGGRKPVEPRTLQNHFKRMLQDAQLPNRNFHILRHTFATNCIDGGTDVKSLSEILGHSDVQITLNRYVHPSMATKRKHLDVLSGFYGQIYGQAV